MLRDRFKQLYDLSEYQFLMKDEMSTSGWGDQENG